MMESAIVTASFPLPGEYRLDVGVTANWWSGTGDEWEGDSNNGLGFPVYMTVMDIKMTFTGLARACAGGVAVDGVHDFTITGTSKDSNGVLAPDTKFTFSFEKNRGHNYQAGESADNRTGVLHRTKFLPDPAKGQVAVPGSDDEAMTATSNAQGQISIHVLSSDIISDDIKIVAKWKSVGGAENDAGTKACQFAPTQSRRGFIDPANPNQNDDNGWIFDIQRLRYNDNTGSNAPIKDTATASVYLQYKIDYNGGDDASNWEQVNGHEMLFAVDSINVRNGKTILPDKNLYVLFTLTRADGATFAISKKVGNVDGVAAATVKSGPKVADAETIEFIAYDQSQWRN